jgi:hypothetical protein
MYLKQRRNRSQNPLSIFRVESCYTFTSFNNRRGIMLIGYARISQETQSIDLQIDSLTATGCEKIFTDTMSGSRNDRLG